MTALFENTRWVWAPDTAIAPGDTRWMFRRTLTLPADCREARLRITAAFHYLLYINGTLVTRGPARSFDFRKAYDTVDVQPYLRPGVENVLAILAPVHKTPSRRGVLAELCWRHAAGEDGSVATDRQWRVRCRSKEGTSSSGGAASGGSSRRSRPSPASGAPTSR